jgi:small conductance mechanosensitive channel
VTVPNGQIVKVINLSRDWARAVVDVPVPAATDVNQVNETLREVGRQAFRDAALRKLLLDEPSVMGVESLGLDQVNVRLVARTLPGKQFEVGRDLRARVVLAFRRKGLTLPASPQDTLVFDGGGPGAGQEADGSGGADAGRHAAEPVPGTGEAGR